MKALLVSMVLTLALLTAMQADAQAPATAPAGSTGLCKDGTYYSGATKRGACRGHKGVKDWYAPAETAAAAPTTATPAAARPAPPVAEAPAAASPMPSTSAEPAANKGLRQVAAPGGGAGQVWVNTRSKVFHCSNDRVYGKTKQGEYMSEADALAKGNHAAHGKSCN